MAIQIVNVLHLPSPPLPSPPLPSPPLPSPPLPSPPIPLSALQTESSEHSGEVHTTHNERHHPPAFSPGQAVSHLPPPPSATSESVMESVMETFFLEFLVHDQEFQKSIPSTTKFHKIPHTYRRRTCSLTSSV